MIRMRAVVDIESVFGRPLEAKFSMCTTTSFRRQLPIKCSRGRLDGLANVVDDALDERGIVPFRHHPDQRLGPRLADEQPPPALQFGFGSSDALADAVRLQRLAAAIEAHVLEQL